MEVGYITGNNFASNYLLLYVFLIQSKASLIRKADHSIDTAPTSYVYFLLSH